MKVFGYKAYGMGFHSEIELPELTTAETPADVTIRYGAIERPALDVAPERATPHGTRHWIHGNEIGIVGEDVGTFLVRDGREIIVDPEPGADAEALRLYLVGQAIGVLLHQRGLLVLHASAVEIGGGVVAFIGGAGFGKSTTAAALHARGHVAVSDDLVTVELVPGEPPMVQPAFPQFKLWPDAIRGIGENPEAVPRLREDREKRARRMDGGFAEAAMPLHAIYVLDQGERREVERPGPQEIAIELVRHSYCNGLIQGADAKRHFQQCMEVARRVTVRRLRRPRSLTELPLMLDMVEEDVAGIAAR